MATRNGQNDYNARGLFPLSGRQGATHDDVTRAAGERPVDTIAVARELGEEQC
jgi:hypothetical protein